ncbi:hypothetical protein EXW59_04010 (plasmid) [Bacillus mycoides]|uniref:hypothetical protein n=1 Tax=Bacillus cereus group TaxID=86661 RepID=UPI001C029894|nr:hypothetical protein [Bacillus mycoides]MED1384490.1 hypothetical protein [Bacillus mycoides]QWH75975.1 hypothetical protein EXW59_04010 [Bacillus mycoides]QWI47438.1 hypothetical protein EXW55_32015 [Bacillus mycoides]
MKLYNQGEYISNVQLSQLYELMPSKLKKLPVEVCIAKSYEFFEKNNLSPRHEFEVKKMLENGVDGLYYSGLIVVFEDLILDRCFDGQFYWMFAYLLIHELRHCEQAYYFQHRWDIVMSDYDAGYLEKLIENESFNNENLKQLHWAEQDAYTYCYRFVVNHKKEIAKIFDLKELPILERFDIDISMDQVWREYRKKLDLFSRCIWIVVDIFWNRKRMSKQRRLMHIKPFKYDG